MDYRGTAEEWQDYCRKIVKIRGRKLRSIYLQRNEFEFEVHDKMLPGWLIRPEEYGCASLELRCERRPNGSECVGKGKEIEPPAYEE
jgi:hypothetical protein